MAWVRYSRASVNAQSPHALGCCDRCGFDWNRDQLTWQFDWRGPRLQNLRVLVCPDCVDKPQQNGQRSFIIPPDPLPIRNPRQDPYMYMGQSSANSAINNSSESVTPTPRYVAPGYEGYPKTTALTFDSATAASVTLLNGNQTAFNTGTTGTAQGAKVLASKSGLSLYFEVKLLALNAPGGSHLQAGVSLNTESFATAGTTASAGTFIDVNGNIWSQGSSATGYALGSLVQGDIIGIAIKSSLGWFRKTPGGYWNGSIGADPNTSVGGVSVSTLGVEPFVIFGGTNGSSNNAWTINTNAGQFTGAMPLGFTAWSS